MKKINILHLRSSEGIFGAERVIMTLLNNLDITKFNPFLVCFGDQIQPEIELLNRMKKIKTFRLNTKGKFDFKAITTLRAILTENEIDIIHCHDFKSNLYAILASMGKNIKKVTTVHGRISNYRLMNTYGLINENLFYRFFDKIITVSIPLYEKYQLKISKGEKVILIQNGFDFSIYNSKISNNNFQKEYNLSDDYIKIGIIGRLYYDKGHEYLFNALPSILKNYPKVKILIVGEGDNEYKLNLVKLAKKLNIEDNIIFCGNREDIASIYKTLDIIVLPSLREGLPYVILEAMAFEKTIVATSVGDVPQLIRDNETGILISPDKIHELSNGIKHLIKNPSLSKKLAKNAQNFVLSKFSYNKMVSKTEKLYEELVV